MDASNIYLRREAASMVEQNPPEHPFGRSKLKEGPSECLAAMMGSIGTARTFRSKVAGSNMDSKFLTIVALSDTRGMHEKMKHPVPYGDIFVHAGDFCGRGRMEEVNDFALWLGAMPHRHKLVAPGNHDRPVEVQENACRRIFESQGILLLIGETVEVSGLRIFGSPYTPTFLKWHFMRDRGAPIRAEWKAIPENANVVITHGPAYGHGDLAPSWMGQPPRHVGCFELLARLRKVQPKLHIFGHIHDGYGVTISDEIPGTKFLNASVCTEAYRPTNAPHPVELSP